MDTTAPGTTAAGPVEIAYPLEMSRLGEKLEWLRRRLALLEADKDRFLRHVSHELKTPLASIHEGTDLLIKGTLGPLNGHQAEVAHILAEATAELEEQIRNLLAYAEWRSGLLQAECEWFEAAAVIDEVVTAHRLAIGKRSLRIVLELDDGLRLHGQRPRLRVALDNLLSNAVKHAPPGSASISIDAATARRRPGSVSMSRSKASRVKRSFWARVSSAPAATRICSRMRSMSVIISVTGCSTWMRVFISMK